MFSGGLLSHEGPSEEEMKMSYMNLTLFGEGWKEKLAEPTDQHDSPPNKHIVVKVGASLCTSHLVQYSHSYTLCRLPTNTRCTFLLPSPSSCKAKNLKFKITKLKGINFKSVDVLCYL